MTRGLTFELVQKATSGDAESINRILKIYEPYINTLSSVSLRDEDGGQYTGIDVELRDRLKTKLIDLDLSVRALNCLKAAEVETLGDLVSYNKADLLKFRNFGKKSLIELENLVASKNLDFGMNISKYKLDKE